MEVNAKKEAASNKDTMEFFCMRPRGEVVKEIAFPCLRNECKTLVKPVVLVGKPATKPVSKHEPLSYDKIIELLKKKEGRT